MFTFILNTMTYVFETLIHNAPSLLLGIMVAAIIKVYIDPEKFRRALTSKAHVSIPGSVVFGAFTPFCACGSMAVIVSMLTTALPWGPIMAFLTSSPLMSPDEFIMISGIVSLEFAVALTIASVIIGLGAGYITYFIEKKTNLLRDQARFAQASASSCGCKSETVQSSCCEKVYPINCCSSKAEPAMAVMSTINGFASEVASCCTATTINTQFRRLTEKYKLKELFKVFYEVGIKQVLVFFSLFAAIGYMINQFVPAELITRFLGSGNILAVPILSLVGLPLYVTGSSSIPIISTLMSSGASSGALLAFMITGPGTSAGVIAGIATIMKRKAIALYITFMLVFAIVLGYLYDFLIMLGI
ncbi:MAG: permease [Bacillota bacterium]